LEWGVILKPAEIAIMTVLVIVISIQIIVFNLGAVMSGVLVERSKRQQERILIVEKLAVLGRVAMAVGQEIKDILLAINKMASIPNELKSDSFSIEFEKKLFRLAKMAEILSAYSPAERLQLFSHDLNAAIFPVAQLIKMIRVNFLVIG